MAEGILNPIPQLEADFDFDIYTKQEVDALLDEKADKSDTYTKTETDALLDDKADADAVYTKTETDNLLNGKADADSVYTKQEIDTKIPSSVGSATKPTYVNGGVITECTHELNKTVPANAVFTDTTYSAGNGLNLSGTSFSAKAGTNVTVDASGINVNGGGAVANADSGLISGGTAYTELRPTLDGTWVKNTQTTATNLQKLEGGIEYLYGLLSHQYDQLKKYINGNYYDYDTDTDSKYTKSVPNGAMPYASLDSIGGKTIVWNQLIQNGDFADNTGWAGQQASLSVSDNVATITGTSNYARLQRTSGYVPNVVAGHKYILSCELWKNMALGNTCRAILVRIGATGGGAFWNASVNTWERFSVIIAPTQTNDPSDYFYLADAGNDYAAGYEAKIRNVYFIDLTLMFGSGNEPSTVAEFQQMFPASYYAFTQGELLSAGVTSVISKKADTTTIATYSIPAEIRNLEGYGWSAGTAYNYIDYENKKFVQNVMSVVLDGTQTTGAYSFASPQCRCSYKVTGIETTTDSVNVDNKIVSSYLPNGSNTDSQNGVPCVFRRGNGGEEIFVSLGSIGISAGVTDVTSFNTYMSNHPLTVYVVMATPIETDISQYITDDNLIEVEAGGTLTFPNSNGDDYRIDVPSQETYMIDLQSAL